MSALLLLESDGQYPSHHAVLGLHTEGIECFEGGQACLLAKGILVQPMACEVSHS